MEEKQFALDVEIHRLLEFRGQDALAPVVSESCRDRGQIAFGRRAPVSGVATTGFCPVLQRLISATDFSFFRVLSFLMLFSE